MVPGLGYMQEVIGFSASSMAIAHMKLNKDGKNYTFEVHMSNKKLTRTQAILYFKYKDPAGLHFSWKTMGGLPKSDREIDKLKLMVESVIVRTYGLLFRGGN